MILVVVVIRWQAGDELIQENTQAVEVDGPIVRQVLKYFGAEVLGTAADCLRLAVFCEVLL